MSLVNPMQTANSRGRIQLSLVLPAYNEVENLGPLIKALTDILKQDETVYEIIVVDDGSSDATFERLQALAKENENLRCISFSRNFGKEAAILAGLDTACGDAVITMDADLQHPPSAIPEFLACWRNGADVVHGVKVNRDADNKITRGRAALFNAMVGRLADIDLKGASDFKLLDRKVVDILSKQFPERRRFYRGLASWVGFNQAFVPLTIEARPAGSRSWGFLSLADLALTAIVSFTSAPLRIIHLLGGLLLVFGFVISADAVWSWFNGQAVSGFATIIITLLILGSLIMLSLGIIGEYLAKIYDEIKLRPTYLIARRTGFAEDTVDHSKARQSGKEAEPMN